MNIKMATDTFVIQSALKYISGENADVCRLCFASTENGEISVDDNVEARTCYDNITLTIREILIDLGVSYEPSLPQVLCQTCAYSTINSYLFKILCQYSNEKWTEAVDELQQSLSKANMLSPNVQTAFIVVNKDENVFYTSKKFTSMKTKSAALLKIKQIMAGKVKYMNQIKQLVCEECGVKCSSMRNLERHMKLQHFYKEGVAPQDIKEIRKRIVPCKHCAKTFRTETQLSAHSIRVHSAKKYQCSKCTKMFSCRSLLNTHDRNYHVGTYCNVCLLLCPSRYALKKHMNIHEDNTCHKCDKSFKNRCTYKKHIQVCGDPSTKICKFFCDICSNGYRHKSGLRGHLRMAHGFGKVVSCNWCSKKFDAISKLRLHIVKHTRERNFCCDYCDGKFVTPAALRYHVRLHTGERPFPCDLCDESFLSASRRMEHKYRKHFEPSKECPICHVKFPTGSQLKKHVPRHSNPHSKLYVPVFDKNVE